MAKKKTTKAASKEATAKKKAEKKAAAEQKKADKAAAKAALSTPSEAAADPVAPTSEPETVETCADARSAADHFLRLIDDSKGALGTIQVPCNDQAVVAKIEARLPADLLSRCCFGGGSRGSVS